MHTDILTAVEKFIADSGLSDHRAGILLARNGRLLERLRDPKRRIWPDTADAVIAAVEREREKRGLDHPPANGDTAPSVQPPARKRGAA
jgi:hypothetical protein